MDSYEGHFTNLGSKKHVACGRRKKSPERRRKITATGGWAMLAVRRGRPRRPARSGELTPKGARRLCTLERTPTPGGSLRSPIMYKLELTPAQESGSARKRRLDRNRQAEERAAGKLLRRAKAAKPTALEFEQIIVAGVDMEQPELSFDMEALEDRILMAQYSRRQDQREAAAVLRGDGERACEREEKVRAAVHLMVGREADRKWTPTGKLRRVCDGCGFPYAVTANGRVRQHRCITRKE